MRISEPAASGRLAYPALLTLGALDGAGYSIIAPVAPAIAGATGAGPAVIGALVAAFPVGILIGFPVAGRMLRRHTARALVVGSLVVLAAGTLGFVLGSGLPVYFASRFLMGLGSGGLWLGISFGTLERWPGEEYLCMSRIFAAYSIGGIIGPALGAIGGVRGPFMAYLILVVGGMATSALIGTPERRRSFRPDAAALRFPGFRLAAAGILFAVLALGIMEGTLPLHLAGRLTQGQIASLFVGTSLIVAAGAAAAARFDAYRITLVATFLTVGGVALAAGVVAIPLWIVAFALAGAGIGMGSTGAIGILLRSVPTDRIVTAMVVWSQIGILGYLVGPVVGGAAAQAFGFGALGLVVFVTAGGWLGVFAWERARSGGRP